MMKKCLFLMLMLVSATLFFSQQRAQWLAANGPNYTDNINLAYVCSNEEYSEGAVIQIPVQSSFIDLIDFYGEGRIVDGQLITGFKSAYNINHQYQLVSNGPDKDRKIPNRIPVKAYNGDLNLSKYVADDKASTITLMGSPIQQNTAEEIGRMIRKDGFGKIIIYGFSASDPAVQRLENELQKIGFYYSPKYILEAPFNEIRGFADAPRVYTSKKMKVTGEKVFYSVNAKTDTGTSEDDMVQLNYSSLLALGADLSGGIKGTIDQPGGRITVEVYPYDGNEADGFQKLVSLDQIVNRKKIVYSAYSDESNVNQYIEKTINVPYGFVGSKGGFRDVKNTVSNNIKLLGGTSRNSWWSSNACDFLPVKFFSWMAWNIKSLFWEVPDACNEVVTKFRTGKQPVILKITIKDATLYDYKIPGIASNMAFNLKGLEEYKMIKKLKVTILESPNDSKSVAFYKEIVEEQLKETNRHYSAKTGNVKHPLMNAEVGNPRILFKNVDLIIKKASRESYNLQIPAENNLLKSDAGVNNNDDETMQLLYIHSLSKFYPPGTTNTRVIRGYSTGLDSPIQNSDYTVCSYSRWSDNIQEYGSFGLTVAHEFGHYFNLYHTFDGGCSQDGGGDQVADTPPAEDGTWYMVDVGTPNERGIDNPCQNFPSCSGTRRQVENIMDYGPCRWLFTKGQADRITDRINTKPSLFSTLNVYDTDPRVNPDVIHFSIKDLRHVDMRRKTGPEIPGLSVRMIYPSSKNGDYIVKVVSDKAEKGKIVIFNDNRIKVYEKDVQVEKGSNDFVIESNLFDRIGLYTLLYTSTSASQQVRILPLYP